jgi:hypothetical protein
MKKFICYFYFVGWWSIAFGLSLDIKSPNLEIHMPFGFLRFGWRSVDCRNTDMPDETVVTTKWKFGKVTGWADDLMPK